MSATAGNPGLRYSVSKAVGAKYRNHIESRSTLSMSGVGSEMPSMSLRTVGSEVKGGTDWNKKDARTTAGAEDEVLAVKDIEYIDSFQVSGDDQSGKTEYVRRYLLDSKNTSRLRPVRLVISLTEVGVYDTSGEIAMMVHALKRIAFATCSPEHRHFSFVAREPRGSTDVQFCHAFLTQSAAEAEELNMLVASAFRMAYAKSQSPATRDNTPPSSQSISVSQGVSHVSNPPLTPMPLTGSPAMTFQDMLRGSQRDSSGPSWSPAHSAQNAGNDELSVRLLQISTPNVDQMVLERRYRRNAEQVGGAMQPGGVVGLEETTPSHNFGGSLSTTCSPPSSVESQQRYPMSSEVMSSNGGSVVARSSAQSSVTTLSNHQVSSELGSAFDTMLMSNLLRTLKISGTGAESRQHGSPVMVLKELIDFHFVNRAFNEDQATLDRNFSPSDRFGCVKPSPPVFTSPVVTRSTESNGATKKQPPATVSRGSSRPLSGFFSGVSNGVSQSSPSVNRIPSEPVPPVVESQPRVQSQSQRNGEVLDDDLSKASWYQPGLPRETVLDMLVQQDVGAFVVRDSTTHTGCYALSIRVPKYDSEAGISHYLITKTPRGTVRLKGMAKEWNSLSALVTHHTVMRELLPCLLVMPRALPLNGVDRLNRVISEC